VSVANKGSYDSEARINTAKHEKQIQNCYTIQKVGEFFIKQNSKTEEQLTATEGSWLLHLVKHHLSY
jgi:hypothetical protein